MSLKLRNNKGALIGAAVLVLAFAGMAYASQYYRISNGSTSTINEWSICKQIQNNSGHDAFIPTNSSGEWNAVISNGPGAGLIPLQCMPTLPVNCNLPWGKTVYLNTQWKTDPNNSNHIFFIGTSGTAADVSSCVGVWDTSSASWVAGNGCKYANERQCQAIPISSDTWDAPLYPACPAGSQSGGDGCNSGCSYPHYYDPSNTQYCVGN